MGLTWLFWWDRYSDPPLVSVGSELILHSNMKTADFLSLLFVGDDQDSEKSKPAGSDGERRGVKRQRDEKDEHGRAYYEFREEAYHSRWGKQSLPLEGVSALILVYLVLIGESGKGWIKNGIGFIGLSFRSNLLWKLVYWKKLSAGIYIRYSLKQTMSCRHLSKRGLWLHCICFSLACVAQSLRHPLKKRQKRRRKIKLLWTWTRVCIRQTGWGFNQSEVILEIKISWPANFKRFSTWEILYPFLTTEYTCVLFAGT